MKIYGLGLACIGLALLAGCCCSEKSQEAPQEQSDIEVYVANVLGDKEFKDAHIKGSKHVASVNLSFENVEKETKGWDKNRPVVVYCSNYWCSASGEVARKLMALGFTDVYAFEAGMAEWYQLSKANPDYEVEGPAKEGYLNLVVKKPNKEAHDIKIITAQELQKMIKEANIAS